MKVEYIKCKGKEISNYIEDIARLRINVFKEFPYLYEGSYEEEKEYLKIYEQSDQSLVILAQYDNKVIGASTCIPMRDETEEFYQSFIDKNIDIQRVFYFGESVILKEYRGNKIGHEFFKLRESYAQECIDNLEYTTFCAVDRENDHPLKPESYKPLDKFWQRMGYVKHENMKVYYPWKDIDKQQEDTKAMTLWLKQWT